MAIICCQELISSLTRAETVDEIHLTCSELCEQLGFDRFLYGSMIPTTFNKPHFIYISNYPAEWRARYESENYMGIDPVVTHCASHITPVTWDYITQMGQQDENTRQFMYEAKGFGLNSGISIPVHTPQGEFAIFNLSSIQNNSYTNKHILQVMPHAQLFTAYVHEAVRRVFANDILPLGQVNLTRREKECLLWVADGKTAWETSQILGVSERTIVFHMQNSAEKLNVVNRAQTVARAVSLGLITPQLA
ncbi:MAG TPA: LuxR family transcriptional regulator [Gammaproteobacteria bacterium]|nr:LuxR family transcriptional regulator [Gammaproteobacteria bacterium]